MLKRKAKEATILRTISITAVTTVEQVTYRETEQQLQQAINDLPAQQKLVFTLSRQQGLSQQEISEQLQITVPTVKSHMTQALRFLRQRCKHFSPLIKSLLFFF